MEQHRTDAYNRVFTLDGKVDYRATDKKDAADREIFTYDEVDSKERQSTI